MVAAVKEETRQYLGDYLRQKGIPLRKPFRCLNPDHEDRNPSMAYHAQGQKVRCFACGASYDIFDLVGLDYGLTDFRDQLEKARSLFGVEAPTTAPMRDKPAPKPPVFEDKTAALERLRAGSQGDLSYFLARGVTAESAARHGLFQAGGRAYFPVMEGNACTGWCGRAIDPATEPRYLNSAGTLGLWNGDRLREDGGGRDLFVTEGILDALCLEQMGEAAVALCGCQNTAKFLDRCRSSPNSGTWRYVACGDPDQAGTSMNRRLAEGLAGQGLECRTLDLAPADGDVAALFQRDPDRLRAILASGKTAREQPEAVNSYDTASAAADLKAFFSDEGKLARGAAVSTGFSRLDKLLDGGLHPGLIVVGAISSLGKTSLLLQMADEIARTGRDVLFFSLEQSRYELLAKSLSRVSARLDRRGAFTARQLMTGAAGSSPGGQRLLEAVRREYEAVASRLFLREGLADIGTAEIRADVEDHRRRRGAAPVVIVDYLQILRPQEARLSDKQSTDRNVVDLKRLSRDYGVPVIAISSFNRENYRTAVSMEAFKESGAVEYSSDVLLGLQLKGAGEKGFQADKAKLRNPRQLELVMLKNRNGIPFAKVGLAYDARFNLFEETP